MSSAFGHPVIFEGGTVVWSQAKKGSQDTSLFYSVTSRIAVGATVLTRTDHQIAIPRVNLRLARWNRLDSQANIYLAGGRGFERYEGRSTAADYLNLSADWENRRLYAMIEHEYLKRGRYIAADGVTGNQTKLRLGLAPYLSDFEELGTWFVVQIQIADPESLADARLTQLLRFYFRNVLWEIGADTSGEFAFNLMLHL
jgi:hypothetical protein